MRKFLIAAALLSSVLVAGCTDAPSTERVLRQQGYTEVTTTGYGFLGCGKDDTVRTGFAATAPNGERVTGTVCGGLLFKNNTVRLD